jgi:hypothetical protein
MKKYKIDSYNPTTFEKSNIETSLPETLVTEIEKVLGNIEGLTPTPILINPTDLSISIGIIEDKERTLKYRVSITSCN